MEINNLVIAILIVLFIAFIYFVIKRNKKDLRDLKKELNQKELPIDKHSGDKI